MAEHPRREEIRVTRCGSLWVCEVGARAVDVKIVTQLLYPDVGGPTGEVQNAAHVVFSGHQRGRRGSTQPSRYLVDK